MTTSITCSVWSLMAFDLSDKQEIRGATIADVSADGTDSMF